MAKLDDCFCCFCRKWRRKLVHYFCLINVQNWSGGNKTMYWRKKGEQMGQYGAQKCGGKCGEGTDLHQQKCGWLLPSQRRTRPVQTSSPIPTQLRINPPPPRPIFTFFPHIYFLFHHCFCFVPTKWLSFFWSPPYSPINRFIQFPFNSLFIIKLNHFGDNLAVD